MRVAETEAPRRGAKPKGALNDLPARIAVGAPALAIVIAAVVVGDAALAALLAVAAGLAAWEAMRLLADSKAAGMTTGALAAGLVVAVALWEREALAPAVACAFGALVLGVIFEGREGRRVAPVLAGTMAVIWVGGGLAHAVLLRELDHGGALVLLVLVGTFVGDTAAHLLGSLFGRTRLAPSISPNKTVEGLVAGIAGGTVAVICVALVAEPWLGAGDAALIGLGVAIAAPLGDLWESVIKREAGVKDSGTLLGAHGGVLDRIDAVLFTVPLGYYLALALL